MSSKKLIVTVKEGKVRGVPRTSNFSGAEYYSFFGIPYGQSTGNFNRFKDPVKVRPWKNIFDATNEHKDGCSQFAVALGRFAGSEDCLYNNIHTPHIPEKGDPLKPVIVLIHRGGLIHGSPETAYYGSPEYVMHRDVVYVGIAYRLHILGFLNLGLEHCSGNQGLKDIILSLEWIKENISAFGGDPNNITLLGSSSGAATVHYLMLSPRAKGLFHKAVLMGMYAFNPTLNTKIEHKEEAYECAAMLDYCKGKENDDKKLLAQFKKSFLNTFLQMRTEAINREKLALLFPSSLFSETVDIGENAVLPESPENLIDSTARIPIMFGTCQHEAILGFKPMLLKGTLSNFYSTYRQNEWGWGRDLTDSDVKLIKDQVEAFYFNGSSLATTPLSLKVRVQSDIAFSSVYSTLLDVISKDLPSSVYIYDFQFNGNALTLKDLVNPTLTEPLTGTFHGGDFNYWAQTPEAWANLASKQWGTEKYSLTPESRQMVETFTKLISTFARTGNPNYEGLQVEWKPSTPEKPCYLTINKTLNMTDGKLNGKGMQFWEDIQKQFIKK